MAIQSFYKDIPLTFAINPITKDISFAKNEEAVKKALINLLKTEKGTRPFRPDFGIDLKRYLFQPADFQTEVQINDEIAAAVKRFEPRVDVLEIESVFESASAIKVVIKYFVNGLPKEQILETTITNRVT